MKTAGLPVSQTIRSLLWCTALAVIYLIFILVLPIHHATVIGHYHPSEFEFRMLRAAIALPAIAVWYVAFWGYAKLHEYSQAIITSKEGPHFQRLATGCAWLAWWLPITSIISYILIASANRWPSLNSTVIIISNFVALIIPLIAFIIINIGATHMVSRKRPSLNLMSARIMMFLFLITGMAYCFFVFRNLDLTSLTSTHNPYYLPVWLLIITVIIPYLYAWFIGLLAAYELALYSFHIRGVLYRKALVYLISGLVVIVVTSIALQYISSVLPRTNSFVFNYKIILVSIVHIFEGFGFVLLAYGANRLKKIEEV